MRKSKRNLVILFVSMLLLTLTLGVTAFATPKDYSNTLPGIGQKTLVSGTRAASGSTWDHTMKSTSQVPSMVCWCDATISGTWTLATNDRTFYNNDTKVTCNWDKFIPVAGASARLRVNPNLQYGGQTIVGTIDFK